MNMNLQSVLAIGMLLISIIMTILYFPIVINNEADMVNTIAFYVWILSIFAWLIKVIYESRREPNMD